MSDHSFVRLMLILLLLICACLVLLDTQRQRDMKGVHDVVDKLHGRMNRAGILDKIEPPIDTGTWPGDAEPLQAALTAPSNDALNQLAKGNT